MERKELVQQIIGFVLVVVLLIVSAVVANKSETVEEVLYTDANSPELLIESEKVTIPERLRDSDGDGIPDFEEELRSTDPLVPNTLPTVASFQDMRDISGDLSELSESPSSRVAPAVSQRSTAEESSKGDLVRIYGNESGAIIRAYFSDNNAEVPLFTAVIQNQNEQTLSKLVPIVEKYTNASSDLGSLNVPEEARGVHEVLVTAYKTHAQAVENVRNIGEGTIDWLEYTDDVVASAQALINLALWFKNNDIVFSPLETGYVFTQMTQEVKSGVY